MYRLPVRRTTARDIYNMILDDIHYNMRMDGEHSEEEMTDVMARLEDEFPLFQQDYEEGARIRASITEDMMREAHDSSYLDENAPSLARFSRLCSICNNANPGERAAFHCGHAVCFSCAEENVRNNGNEAKCPSCQTTHEYVKIFEDEQTEAKEDNTAKIDDDAPLTQYSRSCVICLAPNPRLRAFYTLCGHIVCYSCAVENARGIHEPVVTGGKCIFCRSRGGFVKLIEEKYVEKKKEEVNDENQPKTADKKNN